MMSERHIILHLSLIEGVGPATIAQFIERKPLDVAWYDIYAMNVHELSLRVGLPHEKAQKIVDGLADTHLLAQELALLERHKNVSWCTVLDEHYPTLLKQIYAAPAVIYWQGDLSVCHEKAIAFVGSRDANSYAERVIKSLMPDLVEHGFTIVSGGAVGADSFAHKETLEIGGATVAILGSGLLKPYPSSNQNLFCSIVEQGGALVSSFPLKAQALAGNFPARNRIIAGLSKGCVVVQAAQKSGALITAHYALEQGREVFAVPGHIDDPLSAGCHELLKQGATLVTCPSDIMLECGYRESEIIIKSSKNVAQIAQRPVVQETVAAQEPEYRVVSLCKTPQSVDEIVAVLGINRSELLGILFDLQVKGLIHQDFAGMWLYTGR